MTTKTNSLLLFFQSFIPGSRLVDGGDCLALANLVCGSANAITAKAGGTQAAATPLSASYNEVTVCAADNDSVMLPPAIPGRQVYVNNNTAHTLKVYGQSGDTIAASNSNVQQASATGVSQLTTVPAFYICTTVGQWKQFLSA